MPDHIVIVGGGVMGSALAYWLTRLSPTLAVTVIERDPSYEFASSTRSAASIRQQFSTSVNIRISQESIAFLRLVPDALAVDGDKPDIGLREAGYLYLAQPAQVPALRRVHRVQRAESADVVLLERAELTGKFPWLETSDLALGSLGLSGEGWFDGYGLLTAFMRKARRQGVRYVKGEVQGVDVQGTLIAGVTLADGSTLGCSHLVNAAGPWASRVASMAGVELPVFARKRSVYVLSCPVVLQPFPLLIDPAGFWIRPEGGQFIAGVAPTEELDDEPLEPDYAAFETHLWPLLAHRIPAFEQARLERAWAGYFEMNSFDHNAVLGPHSSRTNLYFMNGFSGHGMQQAPIVARGVAELIVHGRFETLDLSDLLFSRIEAQRPLREANVIG